MMQRLVPVFLLAMGTFPAFADPFPNFESPAIASALSAAATPLDACGGEGWLDAAVPDGPFGEACRFHDACYRSGALNQKVCDTEFYTRMRTACDETYDAGAQPFKHGACRLSATAYYEAVHSRFGAMAYMVGHTDGQILNSLQARLYETDGSDELSSCVTVANTSDRLMRYEVTLHDAAGNWAATAPPVGKLQVEPGETGDLCVSTDHAPWASWDSVGEAYALTLLVDDPDRLTPFGDMVPLDRLDCEKASGECRHAKP